VNRIGPPSLTISSPSDEATRRCGALLAGLVAPGDVVLLCGGLGAGKTTFTKGLVAALGGEEEVRSPTFTLMRTYATEPVLAHVDCWRLEQLDEVADLALDEVLDDGGMAVIEWGEAARPLLGDDALEIEIAPLDTAEDDRAGSDDRPRRLTFTAVSPRWADRLLELAARGRRDNFIVDYSEAS